MSIFRNALSSDQPPPPQPDQKSSEHPRIFKTTVSDSRDDSPRPKTFVSAFGKLWTAFKQPGSVLAKHLNGKKHFKKLMSRRKKALATSVEDPASSPEVVDTAGDVDANSEATATPKEPDSESLRPPVAPFATTEPTESSISLSSPSEAEQSSSPAPDTRHPHSLLDYVEHQFPPSGPPSTPFSSKASTLHHSPHVHDDLSDHASESPSPSIPDSHLFPTVLTNSTTPHPRSPPPNIRPQAPRIQTNLGHLHVPGSEDENSHSTIRERNSSPASAGDFHGMGGLFEDSSSPH